MYNNPRNQLHPFSGRSVFLGYTFGLRRNKPSVIKFTEGLFVSALNQIFRNEMILE